MVTNESRSSEPTRDTGSEGTDSDPEALRQIAPDTAELAPLRSWLDGHLQSRIGVKEERKLFLVAVTEAVTNAIEAHHRQAIDLPVTVTLAADMVVVEDRGGGLDVGTVEDVIVPSPSAPRGRGLLIIQSICPQARFVATIDGARVELPVPS